MFVPEYSYPGVYVDEISTGPCPIEGVSTSTAGFVGETERGPTLPRLVTSWAEFDRWFGGFLDLPTLDRSNRFLPYAVRGFFENGGQRLFVARVIGQTTVVASLELQGPSGPTMIVANGQGTWGNNVLVVVKQASSALLADPATPEAQWFRLQLFYYRDGVPGVPDAVEDFDDLSPVPTDTNFAPSVINGVSTLIAITTCQGTPELVRFPGVPLSGGTYAPAEREDFLGVEAADPELRTGLAGLRAIREIALVCIPDEVVIPDLADDLVSHCESLRDRFAILADQTDGADVDQIERPRDSGYAAIYYPRLRVPAPHLRDGNVLVPPQGHVAGIYARVDRDRGVHRAPANQVMQGLSASDPSGGLEPLSHVLSKAEQDVLGPRGINVLRDFRSNGRGIRVWGARTMSADSEWKYVNVRRLFIFLEQSIDQGLQWVVFEPNSEPTWIRVRQAVTNFLRTVWRNGALMGITEDEAFFVRCDPTTMTQGDIESGRLICLIGVAPVKPAEFVIFRITQMTLTEP